MDFKSANNAAHKMNTALEMFDADTDHDRTGMSDSPVPNIHNTTSKNIPKKADTPEVNWDKLFQTGNLNVDEHLEKLKKQKEKRKKLMDYAKVRGSTLLSGDRIKGCYIRVRVSRSLLSLGTR